MKTRARKAPAGRGRGVPPRTAGRPRDRTEARAAELQSLTARAYTQLEELIVTLQLPPGAAVSEAALSARLDIGRTPIREALQRLALERLVTILPRRGVIVSDIDVMRQLRLLELRREVERLLARSAARRATADERARFAELATAFERSARRNDDIAFMRLDRTFNELCLLAARNEFTTTAMSSMQSLSRRFWYHHYREAADLPETAKLHANIARAIAGGDERAAAAATDRLLDKIEEFTRATINAQL